ncbi:BAG family molecular chaperone regulator 2-like [Curcuma longa]|uniref:BAG family molecular chaperone regulator 2-like n=1 Tax=Curcuma longa TaxID=136217 RepID=UPI003D9F2255
MIRLRAKKLFKRSSSKVSGGGGGSCGSAGGGDIQWEVRPGGMLVQKRECGEGGVEMVTVRISTGSNLHDISIGATATFGELKMVVAMVSGLEPEEQRLLFKGKEREDADHLHMVGVRDKDKVLLLEDPAIKERKLRAMAMARPGSQVMSSACHTIIEV